MAARKVVRQVAKLPTQGPYPTPDPFLFCVYHLDKYPAGNDRMEAPRKGNGADFDPRAEYRMYHGDRIPGFPQHPHRGFETLTCTIEGMIDHTDSLGNAGRYGRGDLQWMTAGKGICHAEMFPLIHPDKPNHTRFFQIWLNLPAKSKMVDPHFTMHWDEEIQRFATDDEKFKCTVWAGSLGGKQGLPPPPNSFAADPRNDVAVLHITMQAGGTFTLPAAAGGSATNRFVYLIEGKEVTIGDEKVKAKHMADLNAGAEAVLRNDGAEAVELLLLQGKPIGEPVVQHGPFVMNTRQEIQQAFMDYQTTRFGGWPWPRDGEVFPRDKGRFALQDKEESFPPSA